MNIDEIFDKVPNQVNTIELTKYSKFSSEYLEFMEVYSVDNLKSRDIKIQIPNREDFVYLTNFLNPKQLIETNNYYYQILFDELLVENSLIIIAETSASIFVCIGISENNFGKIFLYGWDLGIIKIAENLQLFFDALELDGRDV